METTFENTKMMEYYRDQLERIEVGKTIYPPTIKVHANGNGSDTNNLNLNEESASSLVEWLFSNFKINTETKANLLVRFTKDKELKDFFK